MNNGRAIATNSASLLRTAAFPRQKRSRATGTTGTECAGWCAAATRETTSSPATLSTRNV